MKDWCLRIGGVGLLLCVLTTIVMSNNHRDRLEVLLLTFLFLILVGIGAVMWNLVNRI